MSCKQWQRIEKELIKNLTASRHRATVCSTAMHEKKVHFHDTSECVGKNEEKKCARKVHDFIIQGKFRRRQDCLSGFGVRLF